MTIHENEPQIESPEMKTPEAVATAPGAENEDACDKNSTTKRRAARVARWQADRPEVVAAAMIERGEQHEHIVDEIIRVDEKRWTRIFGYDDEARQKASAFVARIRDEANPEQRCDKAEAARFFKLLDESAETFTFQTFTDQKPQPKPDPLAGCKDGSLDDLWPWLTEQNRRGAGVFVTVNETDGFGRKATNIERIRAVWQEDDGAGKTLPLEPHIVVESSPGKFHRYLICDGLSVEEHSRAQSALVADYGSDRNAADPSRVLRVPGFFHRKAEPHLVRIVHESGAQPYTGAQVLVAFPPPKVAPFRAPTTTSAAGEHITDEQRAHLRSALASMRADDRDVWVRNGCRLRGLGDVGRGLWLEWSQSSEKWQASDALTWDTLPHDHTGYRAIFKEAQACGWGNPMAAPAIELREQRAPEPAPEPTTRPVPTELLRVPGMLGEFCDHMTTSAHKVQRVLSVNAALSAGATIMGRKYACNDVRTNIQLCGIGPTSCGKEHGRKAIKHLFASAGLDSLLGGEELKSGSAIFARVATNPSVLFQLDEFGLMLSAVMHPNAAGYQAEILSALMKMFSSSDAILKGPEYADQKARPRIDIEYPCVNVHATTTGETLWPTLTSTHVLSGFLNRFIITESENPNAERQLPRRRVADIPAGLTLWAKELHAVDGKGVGNLAGFVPGAPLLIGHSAEALSIYHDCVSDLDRKGAALRGSGLDALYGRSPEYVTKVASVVAGSLDPKHVEIGREAMTWAALFVGYWTAHVVDAVRGKVADSEHEARLLAVMHYVRKAGPSGVTRRELVHACRKFRALRGFEQKDILESIVANEEAYKGRRGSPNGSEVWIAKERLNKSVDCYQRGRS